MSVQITFVSLYHQFRYTQRKKIKRKMVSLSLFFWPHHAAHGILVPHPGMEPTPPAVEGQNSGYWTTREVPIEEAATCGLPR